MPPTPTVRGTRSNQLNASYISDVVDVTSACVGQYQQLWVWASDPGSNPLPAVTDISGGGVSSWQLIAVNTHNGPRMLRLFELHGTLDGGDITVTFEAVITQFTACLIDWAGVKTTKPFIHLLASTSLSNALDAEYFHHHVSNPNNVVVIGTLVGGGVEPTFLKSDEVSAGASQLFQATQSTGQNSSLIASKQGGFTGDSAGIDWNNGPFSNMFITCEMQDPSSNDGSESELFALTVNNDTGGTTADTASISPAPGSVLAVAIATTRTGSSAALSSVVFDPTGAAVAGTEIARISIDANNQLHLWGIRMGASPGTAVVRFTAGSVQSQWVWGVTQVSDPQGSTNTDWAGTPQEAAGVAVTTIESPSLGTLGQRAGVLACFGKDNVTVNWNRPGEAGYIEYAREFGTADTSLYVQGAEGNFDNTPSAVIGAAADMAVIAVEVLGPNFGPIPAFLGVSVNPTDGGSLSNTAVTITPPGGMLAGDLAVMMGLFRDELAVFSITQAGGQIWNQVSDPTIGFGCVLTRWWCVFNGTWSADPTLTESGAAANTITGLLAAWRRSQTGIFWGLEEESDHFVTDAASPYVAAWPNTTTVTREKSVRLTTWDENTLRELSLSGAEWSSLGGVDEWHNLAGSDTTLAVASAVAGIPSTLPIVSQESSTGPISQALTYMAFYEIHKRPTLRSRGQARRRASRW